MHRRFLFPLAAGVVGVVAISPVFAAEPSPSAGGKGPGKATTSSTMAATSSTMSGSGAGSSTPTTAAASGGTTTTAKGGTTPTTRAPGPSSGSGSGTSSSTCAPPATDQGPAPQVGEAPQTHSSGDAGSVDVERLSPTELRVAKATPNNGWMEQITAPSGPRVSVKFTRSGQSPSLIRFAGSMDQAGRVIHTRVQSCG